MSQSASSRILSIDALRGITILLMIFVNSIGGVQGIPDWLKHAPASADAMTVPDVVFPAFLFIVGMSIPFAMAQRQKKDPRFWPLQGHIALRTAGLLILGVFMVNGEGGYHAASMVLPIHVWSLLFYVCALMVWNIYPASFKAAGTGLRILGAIGLIVLGFLYRGGPDGSEGLTPQWWGILGLIGWAYLAASLVYQIGHQQICKIVIAIALCLVYFALSRSLALPPDSLAALALSQTGHAIHTAIVLIGVASSMLFFTARPEGSQRQIFIYAIVAAALMVILAYLLQPVFKISKIGATPSWALYSAAICVLAFAALYWLIDLRGVNRWLKPIHPAAANPLLAYLLPAIVWELMQILNLSWPAWTGVGFAGLAFAFAYAWLMVLGVAGLNRLRIRLQL